MSLRGVTCFLQILRQSAGLLASSCSRVLSSVNGRHVPGYRYLYVDNMNLIMRASPKDKVATLSKESLSFACKLRSELDAQSRLPDSAEHEVFAWCSSGQFLCFLVVDF